MSEIKVTVSPSEITTTQRLIDWCQMVINDERIPKQVRKTYIAQLRDIIEGK